MNCYLRFVDWTIVKHVFMAVIHRSSSLKKSLKIHRDKQKPYIEVRQIMQRPKKTEQKNEQ